MMPRFEAEQLRAFSLIIKNGHVYKGFKPVHWCLNCRSALAEAEVEYEDKTSPSVYVRFEVLDRADLARRMADLRREQQHALSDDADIDCHLDHDALDPAGESRGGRASAVRLLAGGI